MPSCLSCGQKNPAGFRICGMCGTSLQAVSPERRKLATLLFCDMSGSTAMGERVDAESVRATMLRYFESMRETIERHGGTVEKFIGDAVMAVFGVPVAREDDALRAVRAASDMQQRVSDLNAELERLFGTTIALRIGVNTGEVVAGDATSRQMIVTGDAVNIAARLEQAAAPGDILLGETTHRLVARSVSVEPVEPIAAKGKSEAVRAFRLVAVGSGAPSGRPDSPMVGRGAELAALLRAFDRCLLKSSCDLVTIVGEAGVGKSRLARAVLERVGGRARVLTGRCLPYGEAITYWPVAEILRNAAGIRDTDTHKQATALLTTLGGEDAAPRMVERVAQAIGLAGGEASAEEIGLAVRRLLEALARRRPLVVVVDDIHWAEGVLLDLLESLSELIREAPLLVVCLARPELLDERPRWPGVVEIEPLAASESERLIERLAGEASLDVSLRERVLRTSGGNPLFAEELVAMLVADPSAELPPTLHALLGARLDRLRASERSALECAAVEGEIFHVGAVRVLSGATPDADLEHLRELDLLRLASASFGAEAAYRFRHILIRDAAYGGTTKSTRAKLHASFADWLEQVAGERLAEYEEIVGYHLEQAFHYRAELGPLDEEARALAIRAASRLTASGRRALGKGDPRATVKLLERSVELLDAAGRSDAAVRLDLGVALRLLSDFPRAKAVLAQAAEEAEHLDGQQVRLRTEVERAFVEALTTSSAHTHKRLLEVSRRAAVELERYGDDRGVASALTKAAIANIWAYQLAAAAADAERALVHARRAGAHSEVAEALEWLAFSLYFGPMPLPDVRRRLEIERSRHESDPSIEWFLLIALALVDGAEGRFTEARERLRQSKAITAELGLRLNHIATSMQTAIVEVLAGDLRAAERDLRLALAEIGELGQVTFSLSLTAYLLDVLSRLGREEETEPLFAFCETAVADDGEVLLLTLGARARFLVRREDPVAAEALARRAVETAEQMDVVTQRGDALVLLAEVLEAAEKRHEATIAAQTALDLYERKGNLVSAERTRDRLARLGHVEVETFMKP